MSKKHDSSIQLTLKPSVRLKRLMSFIHLLAIAACLSSVLPITGKCVLFFAISTHFFLIYKRLKNERYAIKYSPVSGWEIATGQDFIPVYILPSTVVTLHASFLHVEIQRIDPHIHGLFKCANRRAILISADMLAGDDYRRLIVKLKTAAIKQERDSFSVDKI